MLMSLGCLRIWVHVAVDIMPGDLEPATWQGSFGPAAGRYQTYSAVPSKCAVTCGEGFEDVFHHAAEHPKCSGSEKQAAWDSVRS